MKVLVVVSAVLAVAAAQYLPYAGWGYSGYPYAAGAWNPSYATYRAAAPITYSNHAAHPYAAYPYAAHAYAAPASASSQYHAQNELGGYTYGYADILSSKTESKNALGGTVGSYSYLDANNKIQTVNYVADAAGFRVSGTNLPVADLESPVHTLIGPEPVEDTPEVQAAKAEFRSAYAAAAAAAEAGALPAVPAPAAGPAPVEDTVEVKAAKAEFRRLYDEAAAAAEAAPDARKKRSLEAPLPVEDTAEVKAAKAEFRMLYDAAAAAADAAPDTDGPVYHPYAGYYGYPYAGLAHPLTYNAVRPAGFSYGFNSAHYPFHPYGRYYY